MAKNQINLPNEIKRINDRLNKSTEVMKLCDQQNL